MIRRRRTIASVGGGDFLSLIQNLIPFLFSNLEKFWVKRYCKEIVRVYNSMNKINLNYNLPDIDGVGFGEVNVRSIADGRADGKADGWAVEEYEKEKEDNSLCWRGGLFIIDSEFNSLPLFRPRKIYE
jgi:hypothetical protein